MRYKTWKDVRRALRDGSYDERRRAFRLLTFSGISARAPYQMSDEQDYATHRD